MQRVMNKLGLTLCTTFRPCFARERFSSFHISQSCQHLANRNTTACDELRGTKFAVRLEAIFHRAQCLRIIARGKVRPSDALQGEGELQWIFVSSPKLQTLLRNRRRRRDIALPVEDHA